MNENADRNEHAMGVKANDIKAMGVKATDVKATGVRVTDVNSTYELALF